jgi:zinc finger protein
MKKPSELQNQVCPVCNEKTLSLREEEYEIPFFGKAYLFSMTCTKCRFHKADVEAAEQKPACRYEVEVSGEKDMKIKVIKSSQATLRIPYVVDIRPGPASNGFITNVEGVINKVKEQIETAKESGEDDETKKKARKLIKKLNRVVWGSEKIKIIIEDPSGNSAIISDKAKISKLKTKK